MTTEEEDDMQALHHSGRLDRRTVAKLWEGRRRYYDASLVALKVGRAYHKLKQSHAGLDRDARKALLREQHVLHAKEMANLCRRNGSTWVKFAQFLSCRPDLLPREYIEALTPLQNDAPKIPFSKLEPVLAKQWGADWMQHFTQFDLESIATASIGQVHRARLKDGREVAVKIQIPDAWRKFTQDAAAFSLLANVLAKRVKEVDLKQITRELLRLTAEEFNFSKEADNLRHFATLPNHPRVRFPVLIAELSSERILVTEWIHGRRLVDHLNDNHEAARELLTILLNSYVQQIVRNGVYHSDPHPGNFMIDAERNIWILDFGALSTLSKEETGNYGAVLLRLLGLSNEPLLTVLRRAGFQGGDETTMDQLSQFFIPTKLSSQSGVDSLNQSLDLLRQYRITVPNSFISMVRVLITVGGFMQTYRVRFNLLESLMAVNQAQQD